MKILAVDTSSSVCAVAILENNEVIKENILDNGKTHSENFMPLVEKTLNDCNLGLDDIDLIACGIGPGSFTGIRIGIASIKAIAEIKELPIVAVTSLEALAYNVESVDNTNIISMIDARNNQVYCGCFNDKYELVNEYVADDIEVLMDLISNFDNIIFVGDGIEVHKEKIMNKLDKKNISFSIFNKQSAVSVGKCAYNKFLNKKDIESADTLVPLYLRKSQAERMKNANK